MPSKTLMGVWAFLDFALLAAGGISIAFSVIWRTPNALQNMVITDFDLTVGLVLGIALCIAFVFSVGGVIQANHVTIGLQIFNMILVLVGAVCLIAGSSVWFYTLREAGNFRDVWSTLAQDRQGNIQDALQCCGYANTTDLFNVNQGFCASVNVNTTGCQDKIVKFADYTLNNVFTSIYGFMAIIVCLFVCTMCVMNKRLEQERFRKIDAKRGGRGFV